MKRIFALLTLVFILTGCNDEAYESDSNSSVDDPAGDFLTITPQSYWIYDVQSTSEDLPNMDFTAQDSIYVTSVSGNDVMLSANDNGMANGSMNGILTNGTMGVTPTSLSFSGGLELPENFSDLGLDNGLEVNDLLIFDLESENNDIMFVQEATATEVLNIQGTQIPVELDYELTTTKVNFYETMTLNGTEYNNVFEGTLNLSLGVVGTFNLGLFTQTLAIIEPQNILETSYFYAEQIGLVRAQSVQGFNLSSQFNALVELANIPFDFPTSISVENVEELSDYSIE